MRARNFVLAALVTPALCALDPDQMSAHLTNGAAILGTYSTNGRLTDWLAVFDDSTPMQSLNLPGTHDSCTWGIKGIEASLLQTQDISIFDQLNAGVRFFDLRFGNNSGVLQLYHADFLLDEKATLEDVLWGFYHFLDQHPTETVMLSLKVDHGDTDATVQAEMHSMLTTPPVSDYWILDPNLGTLGDARHKAILFRRFTFVDPGAGFGLDAAEAWKDNNADFAVPASSDLTIFVEDLYQLDLSTPATVVDTKFAAVQAHVAAASDASNSTQLFVTFVSGGGSTPQEYVTPRILAEGDTVNKVAGINSRVLPVMQQQNGARAGVVLYDFVESEQDLVLATIGSSKVTPNATTPTSSAGSTGSTTAAGGKGNGAGALSTGLSLQAFAAALAIAWVVAC